MPASPPDFRHEQAKVARSMAAAAIVSVAVLAALLLLRPFDMPELATPSARLLYTIKIDALLLAWLGASIANVARRRFFSVEDIAGSGSSDASPPVRRANAVLQNTLEQVVLAFGSHLALAAQLPNRWMIVVPGLTGLFCLGRLLFWLGYQGGAATRAFGFALTFYPSLAACLTAIVLLFGFAI
jgi:hypothetical protein